MGVSGLPLLLLSLPAFGQPADPPASGQQDAAQAEGAEQAAPLPITVAPSLVDFVEAAYPQAAAEAGVAGTVMLLIAIDGEGLVTQVEVTDEPLREGAGDAGAAGDAEGALPRTWGFGQAAAEAARQWRFSPARDATGPVPVAIEFAYDFNLPEPPPPPDPTEGPVQLRGTLREMGTRRPLEAFEVIATDSTGLTLTVLTDADGRFTFGSLAPGPVTVAATWPGFTRAEEQVVVAAPDAAAAGDGPPEVKLWLKNLTFREDELVGYYRLPSEDVTKRTITTDEIKRIPGTFGDPVRVVQNLPGAARAPLGTGLLVIRGANPEDSAVYVDGIRIPYIYHLGGYVSVINADLVDSIDYLPGGYGVEYGRSMGGVLDVNTTREWPDRERLVWSTDLLDSGGLFEGTIGKSRGEDDQGAIGIGVAARRSYIDAFIPLFVGDSGFSIKPRWYDYQVKIEALRLPRGRLSAFVFGFEDVLRIATPSDFAQGTDQDTQGDLATRYSTHRAMLRWEHPVTDQFELHLVPSFGLDLAELNLGQEFQLYQDQWLWEIRAEGVWTPNDAIKATAGIDFIGGWYTFRTEFPFDPTTLTNYDPLAEREPFVQADKGTAWGPDAYVEVALRPLADREKLLIAPGIRSNFVNIVGQLAIFELDPRITARAQLLPGGTLKGGAGLYHQPPQPFESWRPDGDVDLDFERALAAEVGWEQELLPGLEADVALFYKWLDRQIVANPAGITIDDQYFLNEGIGRAYGLETIIRQAPVGPLFGWISYTLSRSVRNDYPERYGAGSTGIFGPFDTDLGWYAYDFDQTHILVAVGGYRLPKNWEISTKVQYVTGNPTTPYSGGVYDIDQDSYFGYATADYNSERLPDYFSLDMRVDKRFIFKRWQLELYVDLLNVVRGENPEFTQYNYDYTESAYIRGLPFIPSPGFEAEIEF